MRQAIEGYHKVHAHAEEENPKDKRIRELSFENQILQEQVQMRQELVEQYEQDVARLRQKIRKLEQQKNWLAKKCEDLSDDVEDSFMPCHVPAKAWIKRAEQATKDSN